ncbi:hypothetical protein ES707_14175 [subsurface metagenome]
MKKAFTQTIIVFVAINLITAGFALAQNAPDEASREEALAARKQDEVARVEAEIAAKVAQKEAEIAQKQMEVAQKEMETQEKNLQAQLKQLLTAQKLVELRIPNLEVAASSIPLLGDIPLLGHGGSGAVLVIPTAQMKIENLAAITADMSIMSRIFDKKLSQARLTTGGSWPTIGFESTFFGRSRSSGAIEAIYLEGYGALFLMKVNVLLSPPPETQEEKKTEEEDTDPLWTETIQEMYAPPEVNRRRRTDRPEEKYDAEKVEDLKETLIKTLKHAANIRNLKPDESVILTVIGKASQSATRTTTSSYSLGGDLSGRRRDRRGSTYNITNTLGGAETGTFPPTVLTIRAKKSDIDAFAKGQLSFDQFTQKTLLLSYSYLGGNVDVGPSRSSRTRMSGYMSELMRE